MSVGLDIPDEALRAAANVPAPMPAEHDRVSSYALRCLRQAAPLIVAAELERLVEDEAVNVDEGGYKWRGIDVEDLRRRAAELRGEG
jgi:hypothetical protein